MVAHMQVVSAYMVALGGAARVWFAEHVPAVEDGQSVIEYGLLAGLLSIASVAVAVLIGPSLNHMYGAVLQAWRST